MSTTGTEDAKARDTGTTVAPEHANLMDKTYRFTRHVYDLSRRYFLLGRDLAIRSLELEPGETLVEMGCGTARNLIEIHKRYPEARLYGVEISGEMVKTAEAKLRARGLQDAIRIHLGPAEKLDPADFGLEAFDRVLFSYSLSMMPTWDEAMQAALDHLAPGGKVHIVDFWDQKKLPGLFRGGLTKFLAAFHVHHRPELIDWMKRRDEAGDIELHLRELYGRYSLLAEMQHRT